MPFQATLVAYVDGVFALLLAFSFSFVGQLCLLLLLPSYPFLS